MTLESGGNTRGSLVNLLDYASSNSDGAVKLWASTKERGSALSYQQIRKSSQGFASYLFEHDVQRGDRVMLWGTNGPNWAISYFGVLEAGAIPVPFDVARETTFLGKNELPRSRAAEYPF